MKESTAKAIGKRIKQYRKEKGFSQDKLSECVGLSSHYISAIERGVNSPKLPVLVNIMNILEVSADEIFVDVCNKSSLIKTNTLSEKIEHLQNKEKKRILGIIEYLINDAQQND